MKHLTNIAFVVTFALVVLTTKMYQLWNFAPQSTHQWRQTDSAGMMLVYTQNGLNFFSPGIMNSMNGDYHTVAEFPIFYYLAAVCCNVFGYSEFWLRAIHLLVLAFGLYYFFRWLVQLTASVPLAAALILVVSSSPVLIYYGFNMLPDPAGLGLAIAAISLIGLHQQKALSRSERVLLGCCIALAGMIKLPFVLVPVGYFLFTLWKSSSQAVLLKRSVLIGIAFAGLWLLVAKGYNYLHHSDYFLARLMPIWKCDAEDITNIFLRIKNGWLLDYFSPAVWLLFLVSLLGLIWQFRTMVLSLRFLWIFAATTALVVFLCWFIQFEHHDYYWILIYPFFMLTFALGTLAVQQRFPSSNLIMILVLLVVAASQLLHANQVIWSRYDLTSPFQIDCLPRVYHHRAEIQNWLSSNQVTTEEKVLNISDGMTNGSLYFLQRHGWNQFNFKVHHQKLDSTGVAYFKEIGAKYLIFHESRWKDTSWIKSRINLSGVSTFRDSLFLVKL